MTVDDRIDFWIVRIFAGLLLIDGALSAVGLIAPYTGPATTIAAAMALWRTT